MLKIKVEHLIGDIVKNSLSEARLKVIGYNYIDGELRYVCM